MALYRSSAQLCTELPVDDQAMTKTGTWKNKQGLSGTYLFTLSSSAQRGATLRYANVYARRVGVEFRTCVRCGSFRLFFGWNDVGDVSTAPQQSCAARVECIVLVNPFRSVRTVTVTIKVTTSGKRVQIDGLIANLNAEPTW